MNTAEEKRVHALTEEIAGLKKHLALKSADNDQQEIPPTSLKRSASC